MATKRFTKSATYKHPAWALGEEFIDGLYIDKNFFAKNIPIYGAMLTIRAKPTKHLRTRTLGIFCKTYEEGKVGVGWAFNHQWFPWQYDEVEQKFDLSDRFYGIGLNTFHIVASVDLLTDAPVIYTVHYDLSVAY